MSKVLQWSLAGANSDTFIFWHLFGVLSNPFCASLLRLGLKDELFRYRGLQGRRKLASSM